MAFVYDLTDTWNAGGTTFNAIKMNVTDTASAAASKLITVQVGGSEKFSVRKDGLTYVAGSLGVGTSSPDKLLHLSADKSATLRLESTDAGLEAGDVVGAIEWEANDASAGSSGVVGKIDYIAEDITPEFAMRFFTHDNASGVVDFAERMRITSAGLVGIGTSLPQDPLHVAGDIRTDNAAFIVQETSTGGAIRMLGINASNVAYVGAIDSGPISTIFNASSSSASASFFTSGSERMRIDSSGRVGIGTSSPDKALTISASDSQIRLYDADGTNQFASIQSDNGTTKITSRDNTSNGTIAFQRFDGTTVSESMRITSAGLVGIGTSSPWEKLSLPFNAGIALGSSAYSFKIERSSSGELITTFSDTYDASTSRIDFTMRAGSASQNTPLSILGSGNVGVGTASPSGGNAPLTIQNVSGSGSQINFRNAATTDAFVGLSGDANGDLISYLGSAKNQIFYTNAAERMRITSAGLVGIGTSSPSAKLHVTAGSSPNASQILVNFAGTSANYYDANTQIFRNGSFAETMRIDSSGNVGIGTSSPGAKLDVVGGSDVYATLRSTSQTLAFNAGTGIVGSPSTSIYNTSAIPMVFGTNNAERMRIDSSGNLLVGTTTNINSARTFIKGSADAMGVQVGSTSAAQAAIVFYDGSGDYCGQVQVDPSTNTTSYVTSSDARLKENIADADDAANLIDAIQVRKFDWKADGSHQRYGMVAQELLKVAPEAVSGEPEGEDMMGVDYSKLVPMLIKEVQQLRARVAQLEGN